MKRTFGISFILVLVIAGIFWFFRDSTHPHLTSKMASSKQEKVLNLQSEIKRTVATVKQVVKKKLRKSKKVPRKLVGVLPQFQQKFDGFPIVNKYSKDWKKNYQNSLVANLPKDAKVDVTFLESVILVEQSRKKLAEKVFVSIKLNNGEESTFNAHVNSQTGQLIQSWNVRRFEYPQQVGFQHPSFK